MAGPPRRDPDFEALYQIEYPRLVRFLYALTGSPTEAEDLAQEAFVRLFLKWKKVRDFERPAAWLRRVAINLASSWRRRLKLSRRVTAADVDQNSGIGSPDLELLSALRQLPLRQRMAIALHYFEDRPIDEVAELLGSAPGTVKTHLYRARQRLASLLQEDNDVAREPVAKRQEGSSS